MRVLKSDELERVRGVLGISKTAFAAKLGVERQTYHRWLAGTRTVPDMATNLARLLEK